MEKVRIMRSTISIGLGCFLLLSGCGAEDADSRGGGTGENASENGAAGSGETGGDDLSNDSFGNTDTAASETPASVDAGEACAEGVFCESTDPDPDTCGSITLKADVETVKKPGNVLVIFDRSGSMKADWNGQTRYEAAGNALIAALQPLQDLLTVGGVFFPSLDTGATTCTCNPADLTHWLPGGCCLSGAANSCIVTTIDQPDQISFRPAPDFIIELPNQWLLQGGGGTPLQSGVESGAQALTTTTFVDPVVVVILTDGEPNCQTQPQVVLDQVTAWSAQGIDTHVVGLPGSQGAADLLNQLAAAGGTSTYIDPVDPAQLQMRLSTIFSSTIKVGFDSCTITLDPPPEAPEKLHLVATQGGVEQDVPRDLSKTAGWSINAAGDTVTLEGQLCEMAKDGKFEELSFKYGCVDLPPLPPPPVVD